MKITAIVGIVAVSVCCLKAQQTTTATTKTRGELLSDTLKLITPPPPSVVVRKAPSATSSKVSAEKLLSAQVQVVLLNSVLPKFQKNAAVGACGSDLYTSYNLPPFTNAAWHTFSSPSGYAWWLDLNPGNSVTPTNAPSYVSYVSANYPTGQVQSSVWVTLPNHYDQYGDPAAHTISFWYQYTLSYVYMSEAALVGIANLNSHQIGNEYTNLPPSSSVWRRVTLPVAASPYISNSCFQATLYKGGSLTRGGPTVRIDVVSWCPVETPMPVKDDFQIVEAGPYVLVAWNTIPYTKDNWYLLTRTNLLVGSWVTNTIPITYVDTVAYVVYSPTNAAGFYRLQHK